MKGERLIHWILVIAILFILTLGFSNDMFLSIYETKNDSQPKIVTALNEGKGN